MRRLSWRWLVDESRTKLWPLPVATLGLAVAMGIALPRLDEIVSDDLPPTFSAYLFGGGAASAQTVLNAIATSLITVTSLTFSLTVLTLQLASSQYSPRLLRTFTRDRFVQRTLALFLGSFVYALTVLRTVRTSDDGTAFVPQISVTVAFGLTLATAVGLVLFLAHLAREIRVETVLLNVHQDASDSIRRSLGDHETLDALPTGPDTVRYLRASSSGFIVGVRGDALCEAAREAEAVVVVDRRIGDAIVAGTPVARVWSTSGIPLSEPDVVDLQDRLDKALLTAFERTAEQDVAFGLRQLTDVAVKALSPGINDPTTAVHALNHSAALMCDFVSQDLGPQIWRDDQGELRVVQRQWSFAELLDLVVEQPRIYGATDPLVLTALQDLVVATAWLDTAHRHVSAVRRQLSRLQRTATSEGHDLASLDDVLPQIYPLAITGDHGRD